MARFIANTGPDHTPESMVHALRQTLMSVAMATDTVTSTIQPASAGMWHRLCGHSSLDQVSISLFTVQTFLKDDARSGSLKNQGF